jgi:hypothetical protein
MKPEIPWLLQKQHLRLRLQAQRLVLAQQFPRESLPAASPAPGVDYPRSVTMRLLTRMPGLPTFLLMEIAPLVVAKVLRIYPGPRRR